MTRGNPDTIVNFNGDLHRSTASTSFSAAEPSQDGQSSTRPLITSYASSACDNGNENYTEDAIVEEDTDYDDLVDIDGNRPCCPVKERCQQTRDILKEIGEYAKTKARKVDVKRCMRNLCTVDHLKRRLPITKWLPKYRYAVRLVGRVEGKA
jgi:hypothetical protein